MRIQGGYQPTTGSEAPQNPPHGASSGHSITAAVERTLADNLRLRDWLRTISNIRSDSTAEDKLIRRIRYMTRRALQGDKV